jgi:hypothetical protein
MSCTKRKTNKQVARKKKPRKIQNWRKYSEGLKSRGDITIWISQSAINQWLYTGPRGHGGHFRYSDHTILICRSVGMVFHQPLRQQQGFVDSVLKLKGIDLKAPDYTVISRRSGNLQKELGRLKSELDKARGSNNGPVTMVVDSTGIKIYGEGEWMTKKHKAKVRKSWVKLHVSSEKDSWINASTVTDDRTSDTSQVGPLRDQVDSEVDEFIGDGAYDSRGVFKGLIDKNEHPPKLLVPPIKGAVISTDPEFKQRNDHITFIDSHGRDVWEMTSGYTMQSKAENNFFRFKTISGRKLASRLPKNQEIESNLGCLILNKMTLCGMPEYAKR